MEEQITITKAKYDSLVANSKFLTALEEAGVDNWEGYSEALGLARKSQFVGWLNSFKDLADKANVPYNSDISAYWEYYEEEMTPEEALKEEILSAA